MDNLTDSDELAYINDFKYLVDDSVILDGNHEISELPCDREINGVLSLQHCTALRQLPEELSVLWDLDISYSGVTSFPKEMFVAENIIAHHSNLCSIANLSITHRNLSLSHCEALEEMPETLRVNGDLDLSFCTNLKQLPQNLIVKGNLYLQHTQLTYLPDHLLVGGDICLSGTPITYLPSNLRVGGCLDVSDCHQLTTLPPQLWVRTFLNLYNSGIECFTETEGLQVGGVIVNPSGSLITSKNGVLKAIPNPTDDRSSDFLLQQSRVPLDAVFMGNDYFVSYQNELWRIVYKRNSLYLLEDICPDPDEADGIAQVLYKGDDGHYLMEPPFGFPSDKFMETWYGQVFYGD